VLAFCYIQITFCAVAVVESASDDDFVKEDAMILAALFAVIAIVLLCSLLFTLTIYALPFYVGLTVGIWVHSSGTGIIGTGAAAISAGIATLVILHILIATVQSPLLRAGLGLIFAAPAAFAAFHAVHGITAIAMPASTWSLALSILGAAIVGVVAWLQIGNFKQAPVSR
jgi:hypothetical protein